MPVKKRAKKKAVPRAGVEVRGTNTREMKGASILDYAWQNAAHLTEEADKRKALEWFVERVSAGKSVNTAVLNFIAAGVEQHLAGKKPWAGRRGIKKKSADQAMIDAFPIFAAYQRIGMDEIARSHSVDPKQVCSDTAEEFGVSEDTVKRAIATVRGGLNTPLYGALERWQAWLESPDGKRWRKDADT